MTDKTPVTTLLGREWRYREVNRSDEALAAALSKFLPTEITPIIASTIAKVLSNRGVTAAELPSFYAPRISSELPEPFKLPNMEKAAARLVAAVKNKERLGIIGDWDVDGACSAAMLTRFFRHLGLETDLRVPDRVKDGFGPSARLIKRLAAGGAKILITADCGTSAHLAIEDASRLGMEVIVADHHLADRQTPGAYALVNPQLGADERLRALCATAVVFLLIVAVNRGLRREGFYDRGEVKPNLYDFLGLVALGTVCDVMPITRLNRVLIKCGMRVLDKWQNPGLRALAAVSGLAVNQPLGERSLGFVLGPRLNAGGRIGDSAAAARLLASEDKDEMAALAERLEQLNGKRREMEARTVLAANLQAENKRVANALVVSGDWHPGLVGLVAGRLAQRWLKPTFAFATLADGVALGSARSGGETDVGEMAAAALAAGLALRAGGHRRAAGLTVRVSQLGALETFIRKRVKAGAAAPLLLDGTIDAELLMRADMISALTQLAPYGDGFPRPLFALKGMTIVGHKLLNERIARLSLGRVGQKRTLAAVAHGEQLVAALQRAADEATAFTVAASAERSPYGTQLVIADLAAER